MLLLLLPRGFFTTRVWVVLEPLTHQHKCCRTSCVCSSFTSLSLSLPPSLSCSLLSSASFPLQFMSSLPSLSRPFSLLQDPSYPVYVDTSVMVGQTGEVNEETMQYDNIVYMPCKPDNDFFPDLKVGVFTHTSELHTFHL